MMIFVLFGMMAGGYGVWWGWRRLGRMPDSVSELSRLMPGECFGAWVCLVALLLMPPSLECLPDCFSALAFLMVAGAVLVAAAGRYWRSSALLHYTGGILSTVSAVAVSVVLCYPVTIVALSCLPLMAARRFRNWCFMAECAAFLALCASLILCFMVVL